MPADFVMMPAPIGIERRGQGIQEGLMALVQGFIQRKQNQLTQKDIENLVNYQQKQQQYQLAMQQYPGLAGGVQSQNAFIGGQNQQELMDFLGNPNQLALPNMGNQLPMPQQPTQPQFPQMASPMGQQIAMSGLAGQLFQPEPFTLSPGQQRFTATGQPIAEMPSEEKPISPSAQISQKKLDKINQLQKKVESGTATEDEKATLDKMLVGQPLVQIGSSEREQFAQTEASLDSLDNLKLLFKDMGEKTGWLAGKITKPLSQFGLTTAEQDSFLAATAAFKNQMIKEITGAQVRESEEARIMEQIPDIADPPQKWLAKWEQSKQNLGRLKKRRMEVMGKTKTEPFVLSGTQPIQVKTGQEALALPKGTNFLDPNGVLRTR